MLNDKNTRKITKNAFLPTPYVNEVHSLQLSSEQMRLAVGRSQPIKKYKDSKKQISF